MVTFGKIAAHSAYDMFSWYKYLIVNLVFSHLAYWSGNLFLIAHFPDCCLLVPLYTGMFMKKQLKCAVIEYMDSTVPLLSESKIRDILCLYSLVCVGQCRKPKLLVFS